MTRFDEPAITTTPALSRRWIDGIQAATDLAEPWQALAERDDQASVFLTPQWLIPWAHHHGPDRLRLVTAWQGDRLAGLGAFERGKTLRLAGWPMSDRLGLLVDPEVPGVVDCLLTALVEQVRSGCFLHLPEVAVDSHLDRRLEAYVQGGKIRATETVCARAPVYRLPEKKESIDAAYGKTLRTRLKRARKKLNKAGAVAFQRWLPEPAEVDGLILAFKRIEDRSWKGDRQVGVFSPEPRLRFYRDAALRLAGQGWLDVATLSLDSRLIAYRFGFRFKNRFLDYNLAHDPDHAGLSPGRVLLDEIIRDSQQLGLEAVDASRGRLDPPHLLADWTDQSRWHRNWSLYPDTLRGSCNYWVNNDLKPRWRRIRGRARPHRAHLTETVI